MLTRRQTHTAAPQRCKDGAKRPVICGFPPPTSTPIAPIIPSDHHSTQPSSAPRPRCGAAAHSRLSCRSSRPIAVKLATGVAHAHHDHGLIADAPGWRRPQLSATGASKTTQQAGITGPAASARHPCCAATTSCCHPAPLKQMELFARAAATTRPCPQAWRAIPVPFAAGASSRGRRSRPARAHVHSGFSELYSIHNALAGDSVVSFGPQSWAFHFLV